MIINKLFMYGHNLFLNISTMAMCCEHIHRGLDCKVCPVVVDEPDAVPGAGGGGGVVADPQVGEVGREVGEERAHVVRVARVELCRYYGS